MNKKNYIHPVARVVELGVQAVIASSFMEEGRGDGGGPQVRRRYGRDEVEWEDNPLDY